MADLNGQNLMDINNGIKEVSLKKILTDTINKIEDNKAQIFDIYETARSEVEASKKMLAELKEKAAQTIQREYPDMF